jgi:hypothetical protein
MTHESEDSGDGPAEDVPCTFHGRVYADHDFYYGERCRRCGTYRQEVPAAQAEHLLRLAEFGKVFHSQWGEPELLLPAPGDDV